MSTNAIFIIVGVGLVVVGFAMMRRGQSGGFSLRNFGFNIGSKSIQKIKIGDVTPKAAKPNWSGIAISVLGMLAALIGIARELV